ncbi:MAG: phosphatase [Gemmataceae bacterium]
MTQQAQDKPTQQQQQPSIFFLVPLSLVMLGAILVARIAEVHFREKSPYLPVLIYDLTFGKDKQPFHYRACRDKFVVVGDASRVGLDTLRASGSAQFSSTSLTDLINKINARKITVVDLRQEAHGFVNELPVSWWNVENTDNEGLSLPALTKIETERLINLEASGDALIYTAAVDRQEKTLTDLKLQKVMVKSAEDEEKLCKSRDLKYQRVPVTDDHPPDDTVIDRFVNYVREMPEDNWLHFHCDDGHGRTTTFLILYDMLRNAKQATFEDIVKRQYLLGGIDVTVLPPQGNFKRPMAEKRLSLLKRFYQYARSGTNQSWIQWSVQNPPGS